MWGHNLKFLWKNMEIPHKLSLLPLLIWSCDSPQARFGCCQQEFDVDIVTAVYGFYRQKCQNEQLLILRP